MARFVNQSVGRPISIKEQENKEWQGTEEALEEFNTPRTLQQKLNDASVTVSSKISITFELKPKVKKSGPDTVKSQHLVEVTCSSCFVYLFCTCDIDMGLSVVFIYLDITLIFIKIPIQGINLTILVVFPFIRNTVNLFISKSYLRLS